MICPYCNNHIQENAKACPYCGTSYINNAQQPTSTVQLAQQNRQQYSQSFYSYNTQAPLYGYQPYIQSIQQKKKPQYNAFYWASAITGLLGAIMLGVSVFMPYVTFNALYMSKSFSLIDLTTTAYFSLIDAIILIIYSIPGRRFVIGDAIGKLIFGLIGLGIGVYNYRMLESFHNSYDYEGIPVDKNMGGGFYFMVIGSILTLVSGFIIFPAVSEAKKNG
ncbi:MAG: zinc ribbon domain-containing protein [Eubacterium sp.]|nr:zinc ribbon domain-containing protein [Eubacterium sp.]